jgi:CheY-like chemotaxis protein
MQKPINLRSKSDLSNRVLILDDNEGIIRMLSRLLNVLGYQVDYCTNGEDLIGKYKSEYEKGNKYKFLILDLVIPQGLNGDKALQEIKEINPDVKAIVSSGYAENEFIANYKIFGFSSRLSKPYGIKELKNAIKKLNLSSKFFTSNIQKHEG